MWLGGIQSKLFKARIRRHSDYSWLFAVFSLPDNRQDRCCPRRLCCGERCSDLTTIISKYLAQLHTWRSSGNNLHSLHRCWPFKRNADFELHLSFQNIAFSLNLECVTLPTDGAILHSPRLYFYDMALQKGRRMAALTKRTKIFNHHFWHFFLSLQQWQLSRRLLQNQKSFRVGKGLAPSSWSLTEMCLANLQKFCQLSQLLQSHKWYSITHRIIKTFKLYGLWE